MAVELLEGLELVDECLVLVLQYGHPVLQTLDVLLLLATTLLGCVPARAFGASREMGADLGAPKSSSAVGGSTATILAGTIAKC